MPRGSETGSRGFDGDSIVLDFAVCGESRRRESTGAADSEACERHSAQRSRRDVERPQAALLRNVGARKDLLTRVVPIAVLVPVDPSIEQRVLGVLQAVGSDPRLAGLQQ